MTQKIAGHLHGAKLVAAQDCIQAIGKLGEDLRGTSHLGDPRDFSGQGIHTSWLEQLEYVEKSDTTVITTRNSIYYAEGNLIARDLGVDDLIVVGKKAMSVLKEAAEALPKAHIVLTQEGHDMTGEGVGTAIVVNQAFSKHHLCGPGETPFSRAEDMPAGLAKTFFLTTKEYTNV